MSCVHLNEIIIKILVRIPKTKLRKLEQEILDEEELLATNEESAFHHFAKSKGGMNPSEMDAAIGLSVSEHRRTLEKLNSRRDHILASRDNLFWRIIWNVITPIGVSIATTIIVTLFLQ